MGDELKEAIERVDVLRCWAELCPPAPRGVGAFKSPFREDRKPSFSIFRVGEHLLWRDHSTGESGGAWQFVERARTDWSKREVAEWFFQVSGVDPGKGPAPKSRAERARAREKEVERIYDSRRAAVKRNADVESVEWGDREREAWGEGRSIDPEKKLAALAEKRGWPVDWCWALWDLGAISFPMDRRGKRRLAFAVEVRDAGDVVRQVGYHMRMYFVETRAKGWIYAPKGVAAWPFVLGRPEVARAWAVLEGQWDAASLWGALGGFEDAEAFGPDSLAVFGLRGAASVAVFLAAFRKMLSCRRPVVWLVADADEAGRKWFEPKWENRRMPRPVSFCDRLVEAGAERVIVSRIRRPDEGYKDFNDYLRRAHPSSSEMWEWLRSMKVA